MTVRLEGDIDIATAADVRSRIYAEIAAHPGEMVELDLSRMTFIDSSGLGVLVGALKKARLSGGDICVSGMPEAIWKVFRITGLHKVFRLADGSSARPA